ncbi:hypothetical protein [Frankia sp. Cppng1_Ct_nod]|uniref:COG4315 family predicted lipoprotein n=1 Tax=Frankia sp. Cppng1_Ct_nod TaxID=2897162 RepID=UPI001585A940
MIVSTAMVAAALAACASSGGGAGGGYGTPARTAPSTGGGAAPAAATVAVGATKVGNVLVGGSGWTLYLFEADKGTTSSCAGACATAWPPYISVGAPTAGAGVTAGLLGTTTRSDGTHEVTYGGHPLYYYVGDTSSGDINGQGLNQFGAKWYVLATSGNKIDTGRPG